MIYKEPSIYNQGGGGGGYNDGGELVDANFIKLENNSFYTYENISRNNINFYFEDANQILNTVVKIDNKNNATLNVYVIENGIYTPIAFVNTNNLSVNKTYIIKIIGKTFTVEEIEQPTAPDYYDFGDYGGIKPVYPNSHYIWSSDMGGWFTFDQALSLERDGWVIPTEEAFEDLRDNNTLLALRSTNGWNNTQGTNTSGLNFYPYGYQMFNDPTWTTYNQGDRSNFFIKWSTYGAAQITESSFILSGFPNHTNLQRGRVRLVRPI